MEAGLERVGEGVCITAHCLPLFSLGITQPIFRFIKRSPKVWLVWQWTFEASGFRVEVDEERFKVPPVVLESEETPPDLDAVACCGFGLC